MKKSEFITMYAEELDKAIAASEIAHMPNGSGRAIAIKMTDALISGNANHDGIALRRVMKRLGKGKTRHEILAFMRELIND